ncbi:MAG TPA: carboxypeptidase-like regulatory domain-containing protein [Pirellulales bacterium]|nr:carboxypeptidase-like regulatory domain-containing protein [Pirellulales bacterium]
MAFAGCGQKRSGIVTYPVTGKVTYKGDPVAGASISYASKNPDAPKAGATTNSDGEFSLSTYVSPTEVLKGAPPGDYQVVIVKQISQVKSDEANVDLANATMEQRQEHMRKQWAAQQQRSPENKTPPKPKSAIPEKYSTIEKTDLKATVVSGANDPVEFKLTDD